MQKKYNRFKKLKLKKEKREKKRRKTTELQKPNAEAKVYNYQKCDRGGTKNSKA